MADDSKDMKELDDEPVLMYPRLYTSPWSLQGRRAAILRNGIGHVYESDFANSIRGRRIAAMVQEAQWKQRWALALAVAATIHPPPQ
jgi:hypothetical protein